MMPIINFGSIHIPTFFLVISFSLSGLLIAAILAAAMSNLSAALNSLSTSSVVDFFLRFRPQTEEAARLRLSRLMTLLWALVLFGLALLARRSGHVLEVGLSIASVAYGAMLGGWVKRQVHWFMR